MNETQFIDNILIKIKNSIESGVFQDVEKENIELKDLSSGGSWYSLKETICAYLNTEGGYVICGINENVNKKQYKITGFDRNNEPKIRDLNKKTFKTDANLDIEIDDTNLNYSFKDIEVNGVSYDLLIIQVRPLSDDLKYVSFDGKFYYRVLTADRELPTEKIKAHIEYKEEQLPFKTELMPIANATLQDLSLDKINEFVFRIKGSNGQTLEQFKPSLEHARSFLEKKHFLLRNDKITLLGMLFFGQDPYHFLNECVEVNAYFNRKQNIGADKKIFRSNIISLMEETFAYVWNKINIRRTVSHGGSSEPEYSETIIRETINNALAHRDYTLNTHFITVNIEPNQYLEIKNPGSFKHRIVFNKDYIKDGIAIKRLIPGIAESKNPKLTGILRTFDKVESAGRGMGALVREALDNRINLPYYTISNNSISLFIPSGALVDESMEHWLNGFKKYIEHKIKNTLSAEHKAVLSYFYKSETLNKKGHFTILMTENNNHFSVLQELLQANLIHQYPDSPTYNPIYLLDATLTKVDFREELSTHLGLETYIAYDDAVKSLLNTLYLYSKYNQQALKASEITAQVYLATQGKEIVAKTYETLGRRMRKICNDFHKNGVFLKDKNSAYLFNFDYQAKDLFS